MIRRLLAIVLVGLSVSSAQAAGVRSGPSLYWQRNNRTGQTTIIVVNPRYTYRQPRPEPPDPYALMRADYFRRTYGVQPQAPAPRVSPVPQYVPAPEHVINPYFTLGR